MAVIRALLTVAAIAALAVPAPAAPAGYGIAAGPVLQELRAGVGERVRAVIEIKNPGLAPVEARFSLYDLTSAGELAPVGSTPHTLLGRLVPPGPVPLRPGEARKLAVDVVGDGTVRYGAVVAYAVTPVGVAAAGVALRIVVVPPGAVPRPEVEVIPDQSGAVKVVVRNTGAAVLRVRGNLFLLRGGNLLGRLSIPYVAVLPGGAETIVLRWPRPLEVGTEARVALTALVAGKPVLVTAEARVR